MILRTTALAAVAFALTYGFAVAAPSRGGALLGSAKTDESFFQQVHGSHGGGHSGGHSSSYSSGPHVSSPMAFSAAARMGSHHHHHRGRVFVGSGFYPYYDYDDCWWSRRYYRWVCPYY
jgi:hypothetical protein